MRKDESLKQFLHEAWEYSRDSITYWHGQIKNSSSDPSNQLLWNLLCHFYNEFPEEKYRCFLHLSPIEGNRGGEPISNFTELENKSELFAFINRDSPDMILWLPYVLSGKDNKTSTFAHDYDIMNDIFHELTHLHLQKESFHSLINEAESVNSVKKTLSRISKDQDWYVEISVELITLYVNEYIYKMQKENLASPDLKRIVPLDVDPLIDEKFFKDILRAAIVYDVEELSGTGAMARKRIAWGKLLRSLPSKYSIEPVEREKIKEREGFNVYLVAKQLPLDLAEEYLSEGKRLDIKFVVALYELVDEYIDTAVKL